MSEGKITTLLQNYYKNYYTFLLYFTVFSYNVVIVVMNIHTTIERVDPCIIGGYVEKKLLHFRFLACQILKHWVSDVVVLLFRNSSFFAHRARKIKDFLTVVVEKLLHEKNYYIFTEGNVVGEVNE